MEIVVASFYHFVALPDYRELQVQLRVLCADLCLRGTILLAAEGVNATIAGTREAIDRVLHFFHADRRFSDMSIKQSSTDRMPFGKMKVRLKQEIIKLGVEDLDPTQQAGIYVEPEDWNALISDPTIVLVDTRNAYEVNLGTFVGAINPQLDAFVQFPQFVQRSLSTEKHPRVAMFCTGGIRCEKASAYLLKVGFEAVYQLKGGILKYLADVPASDSLWQGQCFVFDERISLNHALDRPPTAIIQAAD